MVLGFFRKKSEDEKIVEELNKINRELNRYLNEVKNDLQRVFNIFKEEDIAVESLIKSLNVINNYQYALKHGVSLSKETYKEIVKEMQEHLEKLERFEKMAKDMVEASRSLYKKSLDLGTFLSSHLQKIRSYFELFKKHSE